MPFKPENLCEKGGFYTKLSEACDLHIPVNVSYSSSLVIKGSDVKEQYKEYVLYPFAIVCNDGHSYVIGQAKGKPDPFPFRVDRFKSIEKADEPFPEDLILGSTDYYELFDRIYMHSGKPITAKFLCEERMMNAIFDRVGHNARYYKNPENPNEFFLTVKASEKSIILMAQQYMDGITLIEPIEAAKEFEKMCSCAYKRSRSFSGK